MVSAWVTENRLVFGQVKSNEKSNEITTIPGLVEKPALEGCIVTIDAMGCRYKRAEQSREQQGDYVFSLKGNEERLYEAVEEYLGGLDFSAPAGKNREIECNAASTHDRGHGRIEERDYAVSGDVEWLIERYPSGKSIRSKGVAESGGGERKGNRGTTAFCMEFACAVRGHWGIENTLQYVLGCFEEGRADGGPR